MGPERKDDGGRLFKLVERDFPPPGRPSGSNHDGSEVSSPQSLDLPSEQQVVRAQDQNMVDRHLFPDGVDVRILPLPSSLP